MDIAGTGATCLTSDGPFSLISVPVLEDWAALVSDVDEERAAVVGGE